MKFILLLNKDRSMQKKIILKIVATILFCIINLAYGKEHPKQWEKVPNQSVYNLIHKHNGQIVSSSYVTLPDGRSGLITYIEAKNNIYRCIDWKDKDFRNTGYTCDKLVNPNDSYQFLPTPTPKPPPIKNKL